MLISALWHIAVLSIIPLPIWGRLNHVRPALAPVQIELTWYEPARDLPAISLPGAPSKPSPPGEPNKPLPRRGADSYHPHQTIVSQPLQVTHPRQTLIRPDALPMPPKIEPQLPNIVEWGRASQPQRPRLRINVSATAPRPRRHAVEPAPIPEVENLEKNPGQLSLASSPLLNSQPKLPALPSVAARPEWQKHANEVGPAPEIGDPSAGNADVQQVIALSATPVPAPPKVSVPQGNLSSKIAISPDGTRPGVPGGSLNGTPNANGGRGGGPGSPGGTGAHGGTGAMGPIGISVSAGNLSATSSISGPIAPVGAGTTPGGPGASSSAPVESPQPHPEPVNPTHTPAMGIESIEASSTPEQILGDKRIYTLYVNMPNLTSATGSWVLNFSELQGDPAPGANAGELFGPVPVRKVDPKYPPSLIAGHVEGEVVLYAIIRRDGTVDSIQLLKGVDPELDQNAMEALARWKFRPATRNGTPVELETVVHIPFRTNATL